jgi:hypothetical protein
MMGLGITCKVTASTLGRIQVSFNFTHANTAVTTDTVRLKCGTGTAPANNTASTGTNLGSQRTMYEPTATASNPRSISGLVLTRSNGWHAILVRHAAGSRLRRVDRHGDQLLGDRILTNP